MPHAKPVRLRAPHGARELEIEWSDGARSHLEHGVLRGFCPCATCQGHQGEHQFLEDASSLPPTSLEIREIEQVGDYALRFTWGDGHDSGIYTYALLRELGALRGRSLPELKAYRPRGAG